MRFLVISFILLFSLFSGCISNSTSQTSGESPTNLVVPSGNETTETIGTTAQTETQLDTTPAPPILEAGDETIPPEAPVEETPIVTAPEETETPPTNPPTNNPPYTPPTSGNTNTFSQEVITDNRLGLNEEIAQLSQTTVLFNKHYVLFDGGVSYEIWLYTKYQPSHEQIVDFVTTLGTKLSNENPSFYFNFEIFPKDSPKVPNDMLPFDTYTNVVWRNGEVIFPTN